MVNNVISTTHSKRIELNEEEELTTRNRTGEPKWVRQSFVCMATKTEAEDH